MLSTPCYIVLGQKDLTWNDSLKLYFLQYHLFDLPSMLQAYLRTVNITMNNIGTGLAWSNRHKLYFLWCLLSECPYTLQAAMQALNITQKSIRAELTGTTCPPFNAFCLSTIAHCRLTGVH